MTMLSKSVVSAALLGVLSISVVSAAPQIFKGPGDGANVTITLGNGGRATVAIDGGTRCGGGGKGSYVRRGDGVQITLPAITDEHGQVCVWDLARNAQGALVPGKETRGCLFMHGASCGEGDGPYAPVVAGASKGPSFDCAKATMPADRLVCASPMLSSEDVRVVAAYKAAMKAAPDRSAALTIRKAQIAWSHEKMHCRTEACLDNLYQQRVQALGVAR